MDPIKIMYDQRQNFVIVALTGESGSGCTTFAQLMNQNFENWNDNEYRNEDDIQRFLVSNKKNEIVFSREYITCLQYNQRNYKPFYILKYRNVLLLYALHKIARKNDSYKAFLENFLNIVEKKFLPSQKQGKDLTYEINRTITMEDLIAVELDEGLFKSLNILQEDDNSGLAAFYFKSDFEIRCNAFYDLLRRKDYYAKNFFVHRLACAIRATGNPEKLYDDYKDIKDTSHLFSIVALINQLIKGFHNIDKESERRFVIDSVRNSMEILYLRERYNSFYMLAIHNDNSIKDLLMNKVRMCGFGEETAKIMVQNMMRLSREEMKTDDFEHGLLYAPDISKCVSDSEIHISFNHKSLLESSFYSYAEQWLKFSALISRPGIITPSSDERNMSIAYVAKFNSGCISRQVGCAIVDAENAIQSIGWNDPPSPQLPCNLRYMDELLRMKNDNPNDNIHQIYSRFEIEDDTQYEWKEIKDAPNETACGFCGGIQHDLNENILQKLKQEGLPYPYCFRSRYNKYKGNKDQVNTRSLHAEENTMLRIARGGGAGLNGGTMYVTASPCVLCSKKAYQIGIRDIVYLDPYTDIAPSLILSCGYNQPNLRPFRGAVGVAFYKLYQPFMPYKDELSIYEQSE